MIIRFYLAVFVCTFIAALFSGCATGAANNQKATATAIPKPSQIIVMMPACEPSQSLRSMLGSTNTHGKVQYHCGTNR